MIRQMSDPLTSILEPEANLGYLSDSPINGSARRSRTRCRTLGCQRRSTSILSVFETRPELSTSELARITQVTRQTMHTAVLGLETAGLLERRPKNQRVVLVRPTKRGRTTLAAATDARPRGRAGRARRPQPHRGARRADLAGQHRRDSRRALHATAGE